MNRPLSALEHATWLIDQVISQNFVLVARVSWPLTEALLRQSLDMVQKQFPLLQCKINNEQVPEFVTGDVPAIPIRIIKRTDENHWLEETEKEILEPFPWTKGPLMRVVLLKSQEICDLLVTFCHIASDATSGVMVVKELLSIAGKMAVGETVSIKAPLSISPSSFDLLKKDLKYKPEFLDIPGRIRRVLHKPVELQGDQEVLPEKRITRIIHRVLSQDETDKLSARCKKEKTSVHAALCAAFMQAVVEQIRYSQIRKKGPFMISCVTPVNIRQLFNRDTTGDIGYYISHALHYQLIYDGSSLWTAAKRVKKSLQRELDYGRDIKGLLSEGDLLTEYPSPIDMVRGLNDSYPPLAVTNMGRLDIPEQFGNLKLEELHFAVSINPSVKSGFAIAATSFRGGITINFLYAEPYISKKRAELMVESTMKRLKDAIRE